MLSFTRNKGACSGCSACEAACPVNCISMEYDSEGFWYPVKSDACINCGKCERVCPIPRHDVTANHYEQHAYACLTKDDDIWRRSASGGAFSEICKAWGDDETIVVGAAWDGLRVHHICIKGVDNIAPLCKSKYVASYPEDVFREIRNNLKSDKKVIFCGTPCQVAGLKSFLGQSYDNLLTLDLICHGVGSPSVFQSAMYILGMKMKSPIVHYEFRAKKSDYEEDYISLINTCNTAKYIKRDPYINLFLSQLCLRPSCGENCVFRDSNRQGDITLADFKGLSDIFPDLKNSKRNFSSVVTNSEKGDAIINLLRNRMEVKECSIENIEKYNPLFSHQTWFSKDRDAFFEDFAKDSQQAIMKWQPKMSWKGRVYYAMPKWLQKCGQRLVGRK